MNPDLLGPRHNVTTVRLQFPHGELDYDARYDGRYTTLLKRMISWCRDDSRPGESYHRVGSGDDHQFLYWFFTDPDVAMEFKLRWAGALTEDTQWALKV
ncbi:MAG: hypothetical protein EOP83_03635 [Verrucomicrobiaceae bacterium]|nr:MAG: hypothetical protein EOP83_03635 [Verrucomicrobiaceae bacterium]